MAFEKLKKVLRAVSRALERESNKTLPPHKSSYLAGAHLGIPVTPVPLPRDRVVNPTQLEFEKNRVIIHGAPKDVSAVRRFDSLAGRKVRKGDWESLEAHSRDLKDVFSRISARRTNGAPVRALRYEAAPQAAGLTIRLGRSS